MKKSYKSILCVLVAAAILPLTAFAGNDSADKAAGERVTVIVEVKGDAVLEAQNAKALGYKKYLATNEAKKMESEVRTAQAKAQTEIKGAIKEETPVLFTYTHIFNGFSMEIDKSDVERIQALPDVKGVYFDCEYKLCEEEEPEEEASEKEPYLNYGSDMMKLGYLHDLGYTGKGLVIAVVDSAFDVNHIMFSEPVKEPRLSKSDIASLIKSNSLSICSSGVTVSANRVYRSDKIPFAFCYSKLSADPYDAISNHGTHVAGIAAGNHGIDICGDTFLGAAPDAQLLLMACTTGNSESSLSGAAILAGMEDAVKLGADVINCSFGGINGAALTPASRAVNAARNAGIMVSVAAGNNSRGYSADIPADFIDYSSLVAPASISPATAVASADNISSLETFYVFEVDGAEVRYNSKNNAVPFYEALSGQPREYVYAGKGLASDFSGLDVAGKIALVDDGTIQWRNKALNAQNAGAIGVIVIYNTINPVVAQGSGIYIPIAVISNTDREKMLLSEDKRITLFEGLRNGLIVSPYVKMSSYSSWDTEHELELKPEITAPGGNIYSSVNDDEFESMSGTSMATPFFAGASALLMEYMAANPEKYGYSGNRVNLLENLFMSTADVIMQDVERGIPYSPRLQGAGIANAENAAKTPAVLLGDEFTTGSQTYQKSKISLRIIELDENGTFYLPFKVKNITNEPVIYDKLSVKVMTDSADENGYIRDMRELSFSHGLPQSITVPANGDVTLNIPVTLDKEELGSNMEVFANGFYIDGYVFFDTNEGNIPMLNIPFTGFYGDWGAAPALDGYIFDDNILSGSCLYTITSRLSNGEFGTEYNNLALGYNLFNRTNPALAGKEYVGISPNFDGEADDLLAVFLPLRMVGKTDFAICDSDGNELLRETDGTEGNYYYADKYSESYVGFERNKISGLPDGDYIFKVYAGFRYQEPYEQDETIEMPFYIDREPPEITDFSVSSDGRRLSLSLSDNRYLMGIVVTGFKNGVYRSVSSSIRPGQHSSLMIDISKFDKDTIAVEVLDYAYNSTIVSNYPPVFDFNGRTGSEFVFTAYNLSGQDIPCTLLLGLYLKGQLVGLTGKTELIKNGTSHKYFNIDCDVYDTIKLFTWEDLEGMKPVCEAAWF